MLVFLFLFFLLQSLVLCCCLAAGNDLDSQLLSDREQMEFLSAWAKKHAPARGVPHREKPLYNNADNSAFAVVDDLLHGVLQL